MQRCVVQAKASWREKKKERTEIADETMTERLRIREQVEQNVVSSLFLTVPKTVLGNLVL